jgi:hypothetical protein
MAFDIRNVKSIEDGIDFFNEEIATPPTRLQTGIIFHIPPIEK